jgi:SAM-dependent methyltransferase
MSAGATVRADAGYAPPSAPRRLNWGCGDHLGAGWINSDTKKAPGIDLVADIRAGLPLADNSIDYVVSVHALPELSYREQLPALRELLRVLRPGGVLRLVLPDLDRAIEAYREGRRDYFQVPAGEARTDGGRFISHVLWFGYSRTLFTADFAAELLDGAGFERVGLCSYRRTGSPFGEIVALDNREEESFYIEARKPRSGNGPRILPYNPRVAADVLEIVDVTPEPGERVRGHFQARDRDGGRLEIVGWVVGMELAATEVVVVADGADAGSAPLAVERPDVAEKFPDASGASTSGFRLELVADGAGESQLDLYAALEDGSREPLGRILCRSHS